MTPGSAASYNELNYLLRPSKQVERKLFIEAFGRLARAGYFAQDYTYLGLGSVYYADFLLFHKYLYIQKMICSEANQAITKRMEFNRPYDFIDLRMTAVSEVIAEIDRKKKHLAWLDYDYILDGGILADISSLVQALCPRSLLIVTVDAEPRLPDRTEDRKLSEKERLDKLHVLLQEQLAPFLPREIKRSELDSTGLPKLFAEVLQGHIPEKLADRSGEDLQFFQLFNFAYADGAQMFTFGGLIDVP